VRPSAWILTAAIVGCHPSATVQNTMPVANLQTYRTVGLRVHATAFASQGLAMYLESAVLQKLQQQCKFDQVGRAGATPSDVLLDLNITNTGRGGNGWIQNQNTATLDTLLVLSDGQSKELLGTARIHGESSGMLVSGGAPENEAIDIVAKTVADLLAKSGCSGPRIAKAPEPPPVTTPPGPPNNGSDGTPPNNGSDDAKRAEADKYNADGSEKLQRADMAGALASFQQANMTLPDPKYVFNICLTFEAQQQWDDALAACKQARAMNPNERLAAKIDHRLDLLAHHQ
jgi:tetratricopeptide (TPR) repeat protein